MGWQTHFSFTIEVTGTFGSTQKLSKTLAAPQKIPLDQLFACHFSTDVRELSLNHRKIIWTYQNIPQTVWGQTARELATLIRQHPAHSLTVKTSQAGVAVVLAMLAGLKLPAEKKLHFQFDSAPLAWLEKRFAPVTGLHTVEVIHDPTSAWSRTTRRAA